MTQVSKRIPASPKQAARNKTAIDRDSDIQLFKALGDPTRLRILTCLARCARPCSVTEIAECCDIDFSVVTRHLALLARTNIIQGTKQGRTMSYVVRYQEFVERLAALTEEFRHCHKNAIKNNWCSSC